MRTGMAKDAQKGIRTKGRKEDGNSRPVLTCKLASDVADSFYEVDIKSSYNYWREKHEPRQLKVCRANVPPLTLEKKSATRSGALKIVKNPLIESHYPRLLQTESESEPKPQSTKKADLNTQTSLFCYLNVIEPQSQAKKQSNGGKGNLESLCVSGRKKPSKNRAVDTPARKGRSTEAELTGSELVHRHHHEHHHHYHFDENSQQVGEEPQTLSLKSSSSDSLEARRRGRAGQLRREVLDEDKFRRSVRYTCGNVANGPDSGFGKTSKVHNSSKHVKGSRQKSCSSIESFRNKKCYPIESHTYSDTDILNYDSDEIISDVIGKKDSKTNWSPAVSSFKNHNHSSQDQKLFPRRGHIKSLHPGRKHGGLAKSCTVLDAETGGNLESGAKEVSVRRHENPPKTVLDAAAQLLKGTTNGRFDYNSLHTWAEKIRSELEEIKRELRTIEKEFINKSSPGADHNENELDAEEDSNHGISVFSSRTFILKAKNFYMVDDSDSEPLSGYVQTFQGTEEIPQDADGNRCLPRKFVRTILEAIKNRSTETFTP